MLLFLPILLCVLSQANSSAQNVSNVSSENPTELRLIETTLIANENYTSLVLPLKSDADGRIYVQIYTGREGAGPVLKISPDGKLVVRFSLEQAPSWHEAAIVDFVPSRGSLTLLVRDKDDNVHLLSYDSDGKFLSEHPLDVPFVSARGAAFGSGDLLITGRVITDNRPGAPVTRTFVGLFTSQGALRREVTFKGDVAVPTLSKRHAHADPDIEVRKTELKERQRAEEAIDFSFMESGDDGNIYLARFAPRGPVYRISPGGVATQRWDLPPMKDAELEDVRISKGQLVAKYVRKKANSIQIDAVLFSVVNLATGERVALYSHSNAMIGSAFANFIPNTFTFLSADADMRLTLVTAEPR